MTPCSFVFGYQCFSAHDTSWWVLPRRNYMVQRPGIWPVVLVTAHTWTIPKRRTTSYLQGVPNCASAAPTRCPIQQKDTCKVRRAFLCPCWIANTNPPEHEVNLPTLQWRFVTHEPGSSVRIVTKLWAGRRRNRGSIPNWYRSLSSPKRHPRGQRLKLLTHLPSKVNLKNKWSYTSTFQNDFMATTLLLLWEAYFYWRNYLTPAVLENNFNIYIFFSPGATTPVGGCILQPSSGL